MLCESLTNTFRGYTASWMAAHMVCSGAAPPSPIPLGIAARPDLELIGVHCYSPQKIGKDAGELAGLAPNGVTATGTIEEIIAAKPDVLTFHGVFPD